MARPRTFSASFPDIPDLVANTHFIQIHFESTVGQGWTPIRVKLQRRSTVTLFQLSTTGAPAPVIRFIFRLIVLHTVLMVYDVAGLSP
jgi:hypothetical protein